MNKVFKIIFITVSLFIGLSFYLLGTTAGLKTSLRLVGLYLPGKLRLTGVSGRILDSSTIERLDYTYLGQNLVIQRLNVVWVMDTFPHIKAMVTWKSLSYPLSSHDVLKSQRGRIGLSGFLTDIKNLHANILLGPQNKINLQYTPKDKWQLFGTLVSPDLSPLKTKLRFKGQFKDLTSGSVQLVLDKGSYTTKEGKTFDFKGGNFNLRRFKERVGLSGHFQLNDELKADLSLALPNIYRKTKDFRAKGIIFSSDKPLNFEGKGSLSPSLSALIHLQGDTLLAVDTKEYRIFVSPNVWLEWKNQDFSLKGKLFIPKAFINPQSFKNTSTLSKDAVFVDEKEKKSEQSLHMALEVVMGPDVGLSVMGLKGFLSGSVLLTEEPFKERHATGELSIVNGKYEAYGQDLNIRQGRLLFTGGPLESPQLALRASKIIKKSDSNLSTAGYSTNVTVGVDVSGDLKNPKVQLFSSPSLSSPDILSYLLLGKPVKDANKAGGQLLLAALSSMDGGSQSQAKTLFDQVKKKLDMDISFEDSTHYNSLTKKSTDSHSVVVGKSLTNRLYMSYNMGLSQTDTNVLTLKYFISKFFSLQVNASKNGSGMDLFYTKDKE